MAVRIKFDNTYNVIPPTFVLATKNGTKLGVIPASGIEVTDNFNSFFDLTFEVHKSYNGETCYLWNDIVDFKLVWCREWDVWFEIYVDTLEENSITKHIEARSLGEAELSQLKLHGVEINTEIDIEREDYEPTVLFDELNHNASLLHRMLNEAKHYTIKHVDASIAKIQRTFSFDEISIYDGLQEVAEEIGCIVIITCSSNSDGSIAREISFYDLQSYCVDCGYRDEFSSKCPKCNSENILPGYGEDTNIFISTENLADDITYSTDTDSVKNFFKLKAGDDLMTATILNCNPNGSGYIWYISEELRKDMSNELSSKLNEYDDLYDYYMNEHVVALSNSELLTAYNNIIDKYYTYDESLVKMQNSIIGYSELMNAYYNTIDTYLILHDSLMPISKLPDTTASEQSTKISSASISPVAVQNLQSCSVSTASNAVLTAVKTLIDSRYKVLTKNESLNKTTDEDGNVTSATWTGSFEIENYSDETDVSSTSNISIVIDDDIELYTKQKLEKSLKNSLSDDANDIVALFDLTLNDFILEIQKYCLVSLNSFYDACQTCLNILIEQGVANDEEWKDKTPNLYNDLYIPYYDKSIALQEEIKVREDDISTVIALYDENGKVVNHGMQSYLDSIKSEIQSVLDTENFLGEKLWLELISYRREDTYSNDNYISDGLDNAELFDKALEFIEEAKKEIYKSATLQHSIEANLKNLLVIEEFKPLVEHFSVGNWIHVRIDGAVYKLRLLSYSINFDNLDNISIVFSDVKRIHSGISDAESIANQVESLTGSYDSLKQQASDGKKSKEQLDNWVRKGLSLTNLKIVGTSDNQDILWDNHGLLFREQLPITDTYDDRQLKIINKGLYLTDDNWKTARAGIGNFMFWNPITEQTEEAYGVIADTLVGNLILSEKVGIYNTNNNIVMDESGITITADTTNNDDDTVLTTFQLQKKHFDEEGNEVITKMFYVDENGDVILNGSLRINTGNEDEEDKTLNDAFDESRFDEKIETTVNNKYDSISGTIDERADAVLREASDELERYKAEVGQYLTFGGDEGLTIGANANGIESSFKTTLDNRRLAFKENDITVAYISNSQLNILNTIVRNAFILGKVVFMPRQDSEGNPTGLSVVWNEDFVETLEKEYTIVTQPTSQTVNTGQTATFTCISSDTGQTYNWQISKDGGDTWENYSSGSNTLSYTTTSAGENGYLFRCYARYEDEQIIISDVATLTVVDTSELYIVTQPTSVFVNDGEDATFYVKTSKYTSAEHTYTWEYSTDEKSSWTTYSTDTVNSNSHQITFTNVGDDMNGAYIRCIVEYHGIDVMQMAMTDGTARIEISVSGGGVVKDPPVLTITQNPQDITIAPNGTATFTAGAETTDSDATIVYTWMYTEAGSSKWITGTTGSTFSIKDNGGDSHTIKVKFTASDGTNTLESDVAIILVQSTITINTQPQSITVDEDSTAEFSVVASTNATSKSLSYDWQYKLLNSDWVSSGALSTVSYDDEGGSLDGCLVKCVISDGITTVETNEAEITIRYIALKITTQPEDVTIATNGEVYIPIVATTTTEGATLKYTWYGQDASSDPDTDIWAEYSGDDIDCFMLSDENGNLDGYKVKCVVSDGVWSVTSEIATITVLDPSMITSIVTQPSNATVNLFGTATFSVDATGQDLTYKWEYKKLGTITGQWSSLGSTATVSKTIYDENWDKASVRCTVTGADGKSVVSDTVYIYVNDTSSDAITISTQPESSLELSRGDSANISVVASGNGLKYQWQTKSITKYSINTEYSNISGATSSTYNAVASTATYVTSQYYRCVITDSSGNVHVSNACHLTYS